jgi:hypothetical protein
MERKWYIGAFCVLCASTLTARAQSLAEPPIPVCMTDGFGADWDLTAAGTGGGTFSITGTYTFTFHVARVSGTYDRPANALTLTATGETICDVTYTGSCEPAPGPPLGYCSGTWTNKCFASGTWVGTVTRGACESPREQAAPDSPALPAALSSATAPETYALETYALGRNAPNPFSDATRVTFTLPEAARVRITVYNALGREVALLVDGEVEAGQHEAILDGSQLPTGTYLVRLEAGGEVHTRTLTLVR